MKSYLITDPAYYGSTEPSLKNQLHEALSTHKVDLACFRDKSSKNFKELAKTFIDVLQEHPQITTFLNSDIKLAHELGFDGVHLTSSQFESIGYALSLGLKVIVSTHSIDEIKELSKFDLFAMTYSPIFATPNKGRPKGIESLQEASKCSSKNIIALGGIISEKEIEEIAKTTAYGFASIRYFL